MDWGVVVVSMVTGLVVGGLVVLNEYRARRRRRRMENHDVEEVCRCHECNRAAAAAREAVETTRRGAILARAVLVGAVALFLVWFGGCWINQEYTLRQMQAVDPKRFEVKPRYGGVPGQADFEVELKKPKEGP